MDEYSQTERQTAIDQAKAISDLSGFAPGPFALAIYGQWIAGHWSEDEAIALLVQHHKDLEASAGSSDQLAQPNNLGITDRIRMKQAEADITTLRMASMNL